MKIDYNSYELSKMTDAEIRKAYSRLRSTANKRLSRLAKAGLNKTARSGYKFPTIAQIQSSSRSTVDSELADVSKFLRDYHSTVRGERKFISNFKEIMTDKGYGDLVETLEDIYKMIDFFDELREQYKDKLLPSGDALDALQEAERLNIPYDKLVDNIDLFVSHLDDLENIKPSKGGAEFSSRRMNNLIRKWTK